MRREGTNILKEGILNKILKNIDAQKGIRTPGYKNFNIHD
jgi:hypothetical protein